MRVLRLVSPFIFLLLLFSILWYELFYAKPHEIPSRLIGENVPAFSLPTLSNNTLSPRDFSGHVCLLNVFSSWCYACEVEAPMLMTISNTYHVPIYAIAYKDKREDIRSWLAKFGNPFVKIGEDVSGSVAIDLGVYGTPETYVISAQGKIVYRHVGVISQHAWDDILYPLIQKYEGLHA